MNRDNVNNDEFLAEGEKIDVKKWLQRILRIWPWLLASIIFWTTASIIYLLTAAPQYEASAAILVKDDKKGVEAMDNSSMKELGLGGNNKLVENETEVLKSPDLMEAVVRKLYLYISPTRIGKIRNKSVFNNEMPFLIQILNPEDIKADENLEWKIRRTADGILFKSQSIDSFQKFKYNNICKSDQILFTCKENPGFIPDNDIVNDSNNTNYIYSLKLTSITDAVRKLALVLSIEQATKLATVINLGIKDKNEKRGCAILKSLIEIYNQEGLDDKNRVTDSTIVFLNERLISISDQLLNVEGSVQKFKSKNRVTDISTDVEQYMTLAQQVDVQKAQSEAQLDVLNALLKNLETNQDNPQLFPSTLGIEEPTLAQLIQEHNELILQKERITNLTGPKNPLLVDLQEQIQRIRIKLLSSVLNLKEAYNISLKDVSGKDEELNNKMKNVPELERKYIQITRDKDVQQQIYGFLLQKREEAEITRASNLPDSRIISTPRSLGKKWPKGIIVMGVGFIFGFLFPIGLVQIKDFLNHSVGDAEQVANSINVPLLGSISHVKKINSHIVVGSKSRTIVAEQIRNIRTAITYTSKGKNVKVILATSFQPNDGKSFVSLNLAASYALLDKKTVILEFDLRKPSISKYLRLEKKEGLSSILSGKSSIDKLLIPVEGFNNNFYLLPSGYLPPNPAELIAAPYMSEFMKCLKEKFDYIIIDTPPFSLVADATLLQQYADITLVVLRQGYTSKEVYTVLKQHLIRHPDQSTYLLLNDVGKSKRYQGGYGSYGYGYGKGYFEDE